MGSSLKADPLTITLLKFAPLAGASSASGGFFSYMVRLSYDPGKASQDWKDSRRSAPLIDRVEAGGVWPPANRTSSPRAPASS